jgi:DnaJ-class molecular chaperone
MVFKDYYRVLGIKPGSSGKEIKDAYRKKASSSHPDKFPEREPDASGFHEVQEAYDVLGNSDRKNEYDRNYSHHKGETDSGHFSMEGSGTDRSYTGEFDQVIKDFFSRFFGDFPRGGQRHAPGRRRSGSRHKGSDIHYDDLLG